MASPNRTAVINDLQKVLKKHYKPIAPVRERSLLEHLLYALCLEDAPYEAADDCFARLQASYFNWNEVRVSTLRELTELFKGMVLGANNAVNLKNALQGVFETHFSYDLEELKKHNLGKAVATLEKYRGVTPFAVAYLVQNCLGGHAIPLGKSALDVLHIIGAISEKELADGVVTGLDRLIPKSKGPEFASLLHQLAADFVASPHSPKVRNLLLEIAPDCKDRLPKRGEKKKTEEPSVSDEIASSDGKVAPSQGQLAKETKGKEVSGKVAAGSEGNGKEGKAPSRKAVDSRKETKSVPPKTDPPSDLPKGTKKADSAKSEAPLPTSKSAKGDVAKEKPAVEKSAVEKSGTGKSPAAKSDRSAPAEVKSPKKVPAKQEADKSDNKLAKGKKATHPSPAGSKSSPPKAEPIKKSKPSKSVEESKSPPAKKKGSESPPKPSASEESKKKGVAGTTKGKDADKKSASKQLARRKPR